MPRKSDDDGATHMPTEYEIWHVLTPQIQAGWSEAERKKRKQCQTIERATDERWMPPVVHVPGIRDDEQP